MGSGWCGLAVFVGWLVSVVWWGSVFVGGLVELYWLLWIVGWVF